MYITNQEQADALRDGVVPARDTVAPGVWSVPVPIAGSSIRLLATLCYLVEDTEGGLHLIDPGHDEPGNFEALIIGIEAVGHTISDLRTVIATHLHDDHLGLAGRLRESSGARIVMADREQRDIQAAARQAVPVAAEVLREWAVPTKQAEHLLAGGWIDHAFGRHIAHTPDLLVSDGDLLPIPGRSVRVVETPGHTSGSVCLIDDDSKLVFSGDTVLPRLYPGIGLGAPTTNPVGEYLRALENLQQWDDYEVCPGHEYRFRGLAERCTAISEHLLRRARQVYEVLQLTPTAAVWDVAKQLHWNAGFKNLHGFLLLSALMQTEMHMTFVRSGLALPQDQHHIIRRPCQR